MSDHRSSMFVDNGADLQEGIESFNRSNIPQSGKSRRR